MTRTGPGFLTVFTTAIIITGNMIGAGILALPINLGPAGLLPSVIGALIVWAAMTYCALIIARQPYLKENQNADLPTFSRRCLERQASMSAWAQISLSFMDCLLHILRESSRLSSVGLIRRSLPGLFFVRISRLSPVWLQRVMSF